MAFLFFFKATYQIYRADICITRTLSCMGMFLWLAVICLLWVSLCLSWKAEGSEHLGTHSIPVQGAPGLWVRAHPVSHGSCCSLWGLTVALWGWLVGASPECVIAPSLHPQPSLHRSQWAERQGRVAEHQGPWAPLLKGSPGHRFYPYQLLPSDSDR